MGDGLPALGRHAETSQHGLQRDYQTPQLGFRTDQGGGSLLGVHLPLRHQSRGQLAHVFGIHHVGCNRRIAKPVGAVGPNLLQVHRQGIAGLGPLHVEGPGLWVASGRHLLAPVVDPPGVHRRSHQGIAVAHPQYRRMRPQGGVVPGGSEVVLHGLGLRFRSIQGLRRDRSADSPQQSTSSECLLGPGILPTSRTRLGQPGMALFPRELVRLYLQQVGLVGQLIGLPEPIGTEILARVMDQQPGGRRAAWRRS